MKPEYLFFLVFFFSFSDASYFNRRFNQIWSGKRLRNQNQNQNQNRLLIDNSENIEMIGEAVVPDESTRSSLLLPLLLNEPETETETETEPKTIRSTFTFLGSQVEIPHTVVLNLTERSDYNVQKIVTDYDLKAQVALLEHEPELGRLEAAYELGLFDILRRQYREGCEIKRNPHLRKLLSTDVAHLGKIEYIAICSVFDENVPMLKSVLSMINRFKFVSLSGTETQLDAIDIQISLKGFGQLNFESILGGGSSYSRFSLLEAACIKGNPHIIELLLKNNATFSSLAVEIALKRGHFFIAEKAFSMEPSTSLKSADYFQAIILSGNMAVIEDFMEKYQLNFNVKSCLTAIEFGNLQFVRKCQENEIIQWNAAADDEDADKNNNFITFEEALLAAASSGHLNLIKYFITDLFFFFFSKTEILKEASNRAALSGHVAVVEYCLRELRISPSAQTLASTKEFQILKMFPKVFSNPSDINITSILKSGDLKLIKRLAKNPDDKNADPRFYKIVPSIMNDLIANGHLEIFNFFLDSRMGERIGRFSLATASQYGHLGIIKNLLTPRYGDKFNHSDHVFKSALLQCIYQGRSSFLSFILSFIEKEYEKVPFETLLRDLEYAVLHSGNSELIKILKDFGCQIDEQYSSFCAAKFGHLDLLIDILNRDAANLLNIEYLKEIAYKYNHFHIVHFLDHQAPLVDIII